MYSVVECIIAKRAMGGTRTLGQCRDSCDVLDISNVKVDAGQYFLTMSSSID